MAKNIVVNDLLYHEITKIGASIKLPVFHGRPETSKNTDHLKCLSLLINSMGELSAKSQGLLRAITTADRLKSSGNNALYIMKDANANSGNGEVIAFLKIGRKDHLYFTYKGKAQYADAICLLDFFVLPERQRRGYGKLLFDHMLKDMGLSALDLPIDGPTSLLVNFLRRHYAVEELVPQTNNFSATSHFCEKLFAGNDNSRASLLLPDVVPTPPRRGRGQNLRGLFPVSQQSSSLARVIHGDGGLSKQL